jgi:molybdate transport system substrate-binding protein
MRTAALWVGLFAAACAPAPRELEVFAAASLRESCEELAATFEQRRPGVRVRLNLAASSLLAEQLLASSHGDVYLSADRMQMDRVELGGRLAPGTRRTLLSNELVVVAHPRERIWIERPEDLALEGVRRLSLANPAAVPAGRYAREWLRSVGLWDDVEHKVVPAVDVRAALAAVESGAAEAGLVYATDAALTQRVEVAFVVAGEAAPEIEYQVAAVLQADPQRAALGRDFLAFLEGPVARAVFERRGFRIPEEGP